MTNPDLALYAVHAGFWVSFGIAHLVSVSGVGTPSDAGTAPAATTPTTAPHSGALVAAHAVAFGVLYFGVGNAVLPVPNRVPLWFAGQRAVGLLIIASGAALLCWARLWFRSWRIRARLDVGHELATGGPYRLMRHPIYMALNLLALGTAVWVPTPIVWIGVALMVVASDLRGRGEEQVMTTTFGERYSDYCARTRRFVPGVY